MKQYLVFDIGGTNLKYAMLDAAGNIVEKNKKPTVKTGLQEFLNEMYEIADSYAGKFKGIAISCPGKIDVDNKIIHFGGSLPFLDGVNVQKLFGDKYQVPVSVENDGKAAALAEMWLGALKDVVSGEMLTLGSEVGGGIVVGGQLIHGAHFQAGELSFMRYDMNCDDWSGFTGQKGSAVNMIKRVNEALGNSDLEDGQKAFEAINAGDKTAMAIFTDYCRDVANIILSVQAVVDGAKVVIAGGISAQEIVIKTINEQYDFLAKKFYRVGNELTKPEIVRAQFENDANIFGALYALLLDVNGQSDEAK
ncbi:ROK family protein [Lactobacillus psittaci]|uniref:Transcriptional regulator sugar kinase n=1 Tax=Lactobacillus psittaci DSM 15354 TaxID=1122152 RepID=A0A0R1SAG8_9LACO|nr:ROK family protein [Lactobacillus psittaci]KRL63112.1 transcriptional regulator sugar kinase [Lactobacillus psittaci DSM 15354]